MLMLNMFFGTFMFSPYHAHVYPAINAVLNRYKPIDT